MHGATLKTISAQQFNKMCKVKQIKANYISVKVNGQRPQDKRTTINEIRFRLNQAHLSVCYLKKLHMFRTGFLSVIRSLVLYTQQ